MDKKRRKAPGKEAGLKQLSVQRPVRVQSQPKPPPRAQPALNEKDKAILDDVEHIIWNPDRLKNLKNDGKPRKQAK